MDFSDDGIRLIFSQSIEISERARRAMVEQAVWQVRVSPGARVVISLSTAPGCYGISVPRLHAFARIAASDATPAHDLEIGLDANGSLSPPESVAGTGPLRVTVHNASGNPELVVAMRDSTLPLDSPLRTGPARLPRKARPFLDGGALLANPTFGALFPALKVPGPGGISIQSLAFLYAALHDTRALCEEVGDTEAFARVEQGRVLLREIVAQGGGSLVRSAGDGSLSMFTEPAAALLAAVHLTQEARSAGLEMKVGAHCGPCLAIARGDDLDWFGRTVNVASALRRVARAHEIVCSEAVFEAPGANQIAGAAGMVARRETAAVPGLVGTTLYRLL